MSLLKQFIVSTTILLLSIVSIKYTDAVITKVWLVVMSLIGLRIIIDIIHKIIKYIDSLMNYIS